MLSRLYQPNTIIVHASKVWKEFCPAHLKYNICVVMMINKRNQTPSSMTPASILEAILEDSGFLNSISLYRRRNFPHLLHRFKHTRYTQTHTNTHKHTHTHTRTHARTHARTRLHTYRYTHTHTQTHTHTHAHAHTHTRTHTQHTHTHTHTHTCIPDWHLRSKSAEWIDNIRK